MIADKKEKKVRGPGFVTTKRKVAEGSKRPAVGLRTARAKLVDEVVTEVSGYAPYEKRMMELIKTGTAATYKRALKFARKRLGSHHRALRKREDISNAIAAQKHK